jgi:hypothetical protein
MFRRYMVIMLHFITLYSSTALEYAYNKLKCLGTFPPLRMRMETYCQDLGV